MHSTRPMSVCKTCSARPRSERPNPARSTSRVEAAGDADRDNHHHDAQVFLAGVNDSGHREHDGRESQNDAPPAHIERRSLDAIPEFERVYDEPTILRNEAIVSVVSCQSSVVPCEREPFNEANVPVVGCQSSVVGSEVEAINEADVSVVRCQSSVVPCEVKDVSVVRCQSSVVGSEAEAINEAIVSVVGCQSSVVASEVGAINEANVSVVSCQSSVAGSEEDGRSSRPPASAEPAPVRPIAASKR